MIGKGDGLKRRRGGGGRQDEGSPKVQYVKGKEKKEDYRMVYCTKKRWSRGSTEKKRVSIVQD